ncbi:hypothetical protein Tco_0317299 [Tanacetum coccineum]
MSRRIRQSLVGLSLPSAFCFFFLPIKLLGYDWQQLVVVLVTILPQGCVGRGPTLVLRNWLFSSPNRVLHDGRGLARSGLFRIAHGFPSISLGPVDGRSGTLVRQDSDCNRDLRIWVCLADFCWPAEVSSGNLSSVLLPPDRSQFSA